MHNMCSDSNTVMINVKELGDNLLVVKVSPYLISGTVMELSAILVAKMTLRNVSWALLKT